MLTLGRVVCMCVGPSVCEIGSAWSAEHAGCERGEQIRQSSPKYHIKRCQQICPALHGRPALPAACVCPRPPWTDKEASQGSAVTCALPGLASQALRWPCHG